MSQVTIGCAVPPKLAMATALPGLADEKPFDQIVDLAV